MKRCPFCAEAIQDEAIKCRFCNEFLDGRARSAAAQPSGQANVPWYFRSSTLILVVLCAGPLALPLVWLNTHFSVRKRVVITVIILVLTWILGKAFLASLQTLDQIYGQLPQAH